MRSFSILFIFVLSLYMASTSRGEVTSSASRTSTLCKLVDHWKEFSRKKVRVRALYTAGPEQLWLSDFRCRDGKGLIDISFLNVPQKRIDTLNRIIGEDHCAWVVFEGMFYGPERFRNIDPNLPASIKDRLKKSHRRYGHMDSFDFQIKVTRIVSAEKKKLTG